MIVVFIIGFLLAVLSAWYLGYSQGFNAALPRHYAKRESDQ